MNLDVVFQYQKLSDSRLIKGTAIVVDLLRASTTIICAIMSGAKQVIPFPDAGDAVAIANRLGGERVLGGERGGVKIPGFGLGNSPLEYTPAAVANKTVLLSTTNGTGAIQAAAAARHLYIGALINRSAVALAAARAGQDIVIVCAGTEGNFSADDALAAGAIVTSLLALDPGFVLGDFALCAQHLYEDYREGRLDPNRFFHYSRLAQLGFADDLDFCFREDITDVVPIFHDGIITG